MGKRRVTFHRNVTGVQSITMMVDDDIDLTLVTEDGVNDLIESAGRVGIHTSDVEILETDPPHALAVNGSDVLFSFYHKDNG